MMKWLKDNFITGVLLILAIISVVAHIQQDTQIRRLQAERFQRQSNDLQRELETTQSELQRTATDRDSISRLNTALMANIQSLNTSLKKKDIEIKNIKGRYDTVTVDSLANLMETRAWKKRN